MLASVSDLLSPLSFLEKVNPSNLDGSDRTSTTTSLAQNKLIFTGKPIGQSLTTGVVVLMHSSDKNHPATALLVQAIQQACEKIFGSSTKVTPPSDTQEAPASSLPRFSSPLPDWIFFDLETSNIRGLESPTNLRNKKHPQPQSSDQKSSPPTLKRNFGTSNLLETPLEQYFLPIDKT